MTHRLLAFMLLGIVLSGCKTLAIGFAADALSGEGGSFATDDDPQLVRDAIPFGLKTMESLINADPENEDILLAACSGFTQYAYGFVLDDADAASDEDPKLEQKYRERGKRLLRRALGYCKRAIDAADDDFWPAFEKNRQEALKELDGKDDVRRLYWTAITWAALITQSKDDMTLVGELPIVEALMGRAYEIDPDFDAGAIHEFYISYDMVRGEAQGGGLASAKQHFDRVMELTNGQKLGAMVSWVEAVSIPAQNRKEFNELLDRVLAFDVDEAPQFRLVNVLAQTKARRLKDRADDLFLEE